MFLVAVLLSSLTAIFPGVFFSRLAGTSMGFHWSKDDGGSGDNLSYKTRKAPVKLSPTNQRPAFYRSDALPVTNQQCQSTEGNCTW